MSFLRKRVTVPLTAALTAALVLFPAQPVSAAGLQAGAGTINQEMEKSLRADSSSPAGTANYLESPLNKLMDAVPELKGLDYDAGQERLPQILAGVAGRIASVLPRLPDLVSREEVYHFQSGRDPLAAGGLANRQPWSREFKYLILCHHYADGGTTIEESRTDSKGRRAQASAQFTAPRSSGFAYQWLFFRAENQPEFRFRYLGQQEKEGRKTFVVAFTQDPRKVTSPALFQSEGKTAPFYFQGVIWVDQSTYDIVVLRTDLLAPLADLHLNRYRTELTFRSVPIHGYDAVFWLPRDINISFDQGGGATEETYRYSDYHLFHAEARIVASP